MIQEHIKRYSLIYGLFSIILLVVCALSILKITANSKATQAQTSTAIPRYVSLKASKANTHVGPGKQFPIKWVYTRVNMPLLVISEFDTWRQVKDMTGEISWIHKSLLKGARFVYITPQQTVMYYRPHKESRVVAKVGQGAIGKLMTCQKDWCRITIQNQKGWVQKKDIWGVLSHEENIK